MFGLFRGWMIAFGLMAAVGTAVAGEYGQHYYSGSDGIKVGSLSDPGFHLNMRATYYYADDWKNDDGDRSYFKREIFYIEPELAWASQSLWCGWRYEGKIAVPFPYHQEDMPIEDNVASRAHITNKVGDLRVTPLSLGREFDRFDVSFGYTFFAPTGSFTNAPSEYPGLRAAPLSSGKGYWTHMLNLGGTFYFDSCRTLSLSAMAYYEFHGKQRKTDITYGDNLHFEMGLGKDFTPGWRLGAVGYASFQTTDTKGPAGYIAHGSGNRIWAAGAELGYFAKTQAFPWFATVRCLQEFSGRGNFEGTRSLLTAGVSF